MQASTPEPDILTRLTTPLQATSLVIFRVMLSVIFLIAGVNHLMKPEGVATRLENAPMGFLATSIAPAEFLVIAAGVVLLLGGAALAFGVKTRWAALVLMLMLIPITLTVQVGDMSALGPLGKNIGLGGGLIYFLTHGKGAAKAQK